MLTTSRHKKIWLACHKVDFRKAHSGLLAESYKMRLDPFSGDIIIFIGRNRRRIKVLYADASGLWVSSKMFTLESIKTRFKFLSEPTCNLITEAELAMLVEGAAYTVEKKVATYVKPKAQNENCLPQQGESYANTRRNPTTSQVA